MKTFPRFFRSALLTASEAREMLEPVLDVLVISTAMARSFADQASNILATADQLKLSSGHVLPYRESRKSSRNFDPHDAPETAAFPFSTAADVWSLWHDPGRNAYAAHRYLAAREQADPIVSR